MTAIEKPREKTREEVLQDRLAAAQAKRAALATSRNLGNLEQQVTDEEALAELEAAYPDGFAIVYLNAPVSGLPSFAAARDSRPDEFKRYKSGVKVTVVGKSAEVDSGDAPAQLGRTCRISPDEDTFKKMCDLRPALASDLGLEVVARAQSRKAEAAKK